MLGFVESGSKLKVSYLQPVMHFPNLYKKIHFTPAIRFFIAFRTQCATETK